MPGPARYQAQEGFLTLREAAVALGVTRARISQLYQEHGEVFAFKDPDAKGGNGALNVCPLAIDKLRAGVPLEPWPDDKWISPLLDQAASAFRGGQDTLAAWFLAECLLRLNGEQPADPDRVLVRKALEENDPGKNISSETARAEVAHAAKLLEDAWHQLEFAEAIEAGMGAEDARFFADKTIDMTRLEGEIARHEAERDPDPERAQQIARIKSLMRETRAVVKDFKTKLARRKAQGTPLSENKDDQPPARAGTDRAL